MKKSNALKIELLSPSSLRARDRNPRIHPPEQIEALAKSIREFGFTAPVLIDAENVLIAGHGRVAAAIHAKLDTVPCVRVTHLSENQVRAYVIADNKLALNAAWDDQLLLSELSALNEADFSIELTGFSAIELSDILNDKSEKDGLSDNYTHKIDAPVYSPKGEKPPIAELFDNSRAQILTQEIVSANLPKDVEDFLKTAASRHIVFDYEKIAEFYCHADRKTQELMENSALVIIDFKKALQIGYAKLKDELVSSLESESGKETSSE